MKSNYNYSPELQEIFSVIKDVKKACSGANRPYRTTMSPAHRSMMRRAYLETLQHDLLALHASLNKWLAAGIPMEVEAADDAQQEGMEGENT